MTARTHTHRDSNYRQQPGLFDSPSASGDVAGAVVGATEGHFSHTADAPAATVAAVDMTDHGPQSRNETYATVQPDHDVAKSKWYTRIIASGRYGVTLDELSHRYNVPPNAISGRITELAREKLVIRTAQRRETRASTADRRITAAVIVATRFLTDPVTPKPESGPMSPQATDMMPDQDTSTKTPRDQTGEPIQPGNLYSVGIGDRARRCVKVFEVDCETYCQECRIDGTALSNSRPPSALDAIGRRRHLDPDVPAD